MHIIDGHLDIAFNAVTLGRPLDRSVAEIRALEGPAPAHGEGVTTVSLPALREGGVTVVLATLFSPSQGAFPIVAGYQDGDEATARAQAQLDWYHAMHARGELTIIRTRTELDGVLAGTLPRPGCVLLMEGADPIPTPDAVVDYLRQGVRIIGPAWKATRYAGGTGEPGPLTDAGRALLAEMARLGMALDVSHLAEEAFWEALEVFPGIILASHANCRALVPGDRQLSDAMIRALAARDSVIGVVWYNRFLQAGWESASGKEAVCFDDVRRHIDHLVSLAGVRHVAIGSDLDGGLGREETPREVETIADLGCVAEALRAGGHDEAAITAILGGNWLRLLRDLLPDGA